MSKVIHRWKNIELVEESLTLPNGNAVTHTSVKHPGAAVILPITAEGRIILVNQYRPSIKDWVIELPAGTLERGEAPIVTAKRELAEETGYTSQSWSKLDVMLPLVGFCDEKQHVFVAKDVEQTQALNLDEDEQIELLSMSLQQIEAAIIDGTIIDAKTISIVYKSKLSGLIRG